MASASLTASAGVVQVEVMMSLEQFRQLAPALEFDERHAAQIYAGGLHWQARTGSEHDRFVAAVEILGHAMPRTATSECDQPDCLCHRARAAEDPDA